MRFVGNWRSSSKGVIHQRRRILVNFNWKGRKQVFRWFFGIGVSSAFLVDCAGALSFVLLAASVSVLRVFLLRVLSRRKRRFCIYRFVCLNVWEIWFWHDCFVLSLVLRFLWLVRPRLNQISRRGARVRKWSNWRQHDCWTNGRKNVLNRDEAAEERKGDTRVILEVEFGELVSESLDWLEEANDESLSFDILSILGYVNY